MIRKSMSAIMLILVTTVAGAQQSPQAKPAAPAVAPAAAAQAKPVIDIAEKIKDFGVVAKGEKVHAIFDVHNAGNAPLEISQVRPSCGCTVASFDKTVPPGGRGKVEAEVNTADFNGPLAKTVMVFSNDTENPQVNLVIKFEVRAVIEVLPRPQIRFNVLQGEAATEKVVLVAADASDFKVTGVDLQGGPNKVAFRELPEKERLPERKGVQWEVAVSLPAESPTLAPQNFKILIKTTAPKAPEVAINVMNLVRPVVQLLPAEIDFGAIPGDAPVGRNTILINNRQGSELKIIKTEVDDSNFTTEVIPLQAGYRYQVAVTLKAGAAKGAHKAKVKIETSDAARKLIEIPVQAVVQ